MTRPKTNISGAACLAVAAALIVHGCAGETPADDPGEQPAGEAPAAPADRELAVGQASLSIGGGQVAYPGRFDLLVDCSFGDGDLTLNLVSGGDISGGPNQAIVATTAPVDALAEGSYTGTYDVTEEHEDGNVERFTGLAEIRVSGLESGADGTVAQVQAEGTGDDGSVVELAARCVVAGA